MTLYGLPTCPQCALALKALKPHHDVTFRDIRAEPLTDAERTALIHEFGDRIIDKTTQTYRNLNAWMKESEAEAQLKDTPALMARPVITDGTRWTLGWEAEAQAVWGL